MYSKPRLFCDSRKTGTIFTYFHILMNRVSNLIHFLPQVHNSLRNGGAITSSIQINKSNRDFLWILVQLRSNYDLKRSFTS